MFLPAHSYRSCVIHLITIKCTSLTTLTILCFIHFTFLFYRTEGVLHLDCDPGQSEFAPPGCLSLHTVRQSLQGKKMYSYLIWSVVNNFVLSGWVFGDRYVSASGKAVRFWSCPLSQTRGRIIPQRPGMPRWAQTGGKILSQVGLKPTTSRMRGWWLPTEPRLLMNT